MQGDPCLLPAVVGLAPYHSLSRIVIPHLFGMTNYRHGRGVEAGQVGDGTVAVPPPTCEIY